jgi:hypothetical protein
MTRKETLQRIRALGMSAGFTAFGQYRVSFPAALMPSAKEREASAAYDEDPESAISTAREMLRHFRERAHRAETVGPLLPVKGCSETWQAGTGELLLFVRERGWDYCQRPLHECTARHPLREDSRHLLRKDF